MGATAAVIDRSIDRLISFFVFFLNNNNNHHDSTWRGSLHDILHESSSAGRLVACLLFATEHWTNNKRAYYFSFFPSLSTTPQDRGKNGETVWVIRRWCFFYPVVCSLYTYTRRQHTNQPHNIQWRMMIISVRRDVTRTVAVALTFNPHATVRQFSHPCCDCSNRQDQVGIYSWLNTDTLIPRLHYTHTRYPLGLTRAHDIFEEIHCTCTRYRIDISLAVRISILFYFRDFNWTERDTSICNEYFIIYKIIIFKIIVWHSVASAGVLARKIERGRKNPLLRERFGASSARPRVAQRRIMPPFYMNLKCLSYFRFCLLVRLCHLLSFSSFIFGGIV